MIHLFQPSGQKSLVSDGQRTVDLTTFSLAQPPLLHLFPCLTVAIGPEIHPNPKMPTPLSQMERMALLMEPRPSSSPAPAKSRTRTFSSRVQKQVLNFQKLIVRRRTRKPKIPIHFVNHAQVRYPTTFPHNPLLQGSILTPSSPPTGASPPATPPLSSPNKTTRPHTHRLHSKPRPLQILPLDFLHHTTHVISGLMRRSLETALIYCLPINPTSQEAYRSSRGIS